MKYIESERDEGERSDCVTMAPGQKVELATGEGVELETNNLLNEYIQIAAGG